MEIKVCYWHVDRFIFSPTANESWIGSILRAYFYIVESMKTLKDIAKLAGVSTMTISRYFSALIGVVVPVQQHLKPQAQHLHLQIPLTLIYFFHKKTIVFLNATKYMK